MINQHEGIKALHAQFIQVEKKINDCNRRAQDFLDLFEDIGFRWNGINSLFFNMGLDNKYIMLRRCSKFIIIILIIRDVPSNP